MKLLLKGLTLRCICNNSTQHFFVHYEGRKAWQIQINNLTPGYRSKLQTLPFHLLPPKGPTLLLVLLLLPRIDHIVKLHESLSSIGS